MVKIQNISQIEPVLGFTEFDVLQKYRKSFNCSELGRLHSVFPFAALAHKLGLKSSPLGRRSYFSASGKLALLVLKAYTGFSDRQLIGHLNGNIHYQLFCGILVHPCDPVTNYKIVSAIRQEVAEKMDIGSLQEILAGHWRPYLDNRHVCMTDATCYESYMRYPTDMKLLWECVEWLHRHLCKDCSSLRIRRPRSKYNDVSRAWLAYSKKRKRKSSHTRMLVSVDRHYVRPIVRGKETKAVEFGAKVNNIQADGISFIEHLSFNAFNEGIRLKQCISLQKKLMKQKVTAVAADSIYANNDNRKFCTQAGIATSFVRKGSAAKDENLRKILRSELSRQRATRPEGSFGTHKQHYSLSKIKARNKKTEILCIFFGVHTANAVRMMHKVYKTQKQVA